MDEIKTHRMHEPVKTAIRAALAGGREIMRVYGGAFFGITLKKDFSPLTRADRASHRIIEKMLEPTDIPLLSEEGKSIPFDKRRHWHRMWLVDPLDGTKEFIRRNGEFTVNIAFIENNKPLAGVIFAPVQGFLYFGAAGMGAWRWQGAGEEDPAKIIRDSIPLPVRDEIRHYRLIASRSHRNSETEAFIASHLSPHEPYEIVHKGSSLKLCMIAEGSADIYPRFGPTMEWDTAAGHAIIDASGGRITLQDGSGTLEYNKSNLLNPWFIAFGKDAE